MLILQLFSITYVFLLWFFQTSECAMGTGTCIFPGLCNAGPFALQDPLNLPIVQNSGCFIACQIVCGPGAGGICRTWENNFEFKGANLTAHPTHATCECFNLLSFVTGQHPPPGCPIPVSDVTTALATIDLQLFPIPWCTSCGAVGTTNCYYQPNNHLFTCDCVYDDYRYCKDPTAPSG